MKTVRLDTLLEKEGWANRDFELLVIDVQGAETKVFKGATHTLCRQSLKCIYAEVAHEALYQGGNTFEELAKLLEKYDFFVRFLEIKEKGWGNAVFWRKWWTPVEDEYSDSDIQHLPPAYKGHRITELKNVQLSSSYYSNEDGIVNGSAILQNTGEKEFCFHTKKEPSPFIILELKQMEHLEYIVVHNRRTRQRMLLDRARTIYVEVSTDGIKWNRIHDSSMVSGKAIDAQTMFPLILRCEQFPRIKFIRLGLTEENHFHLFRIGLYAVDSASSHEERLLEKKAAI